MKLTRMLPLLLIPLTAGIATGQEARPTTVAGRSTVYAPRDALATSQPLATAAGMEMINKGGNAFDAAVAAAAVLNVVEPHMSGMGGDMFAIIWSERDKKLVALNAGGRSGALMTREELVRRGRDDVPGSGAESISVPGALSGWNALVEEYGNLTLAQVLEPAIRLAEDGFPVSPIIAKQWKGQEAFLKRDRGATEVYLIDGSAPIAGQWFRNPDLARTFKQVATQGIGAFYGGPIGTMVAEGVRELGGFLTTEDFAKHQVEWITPVSAPYGEYKLWELPPPNQGVAALQMMRLLEGYDLKAMGHNSTQYLHTLIEAKKLAYADLTGHVGDPDQMKITVDQMVSDGYINARRAMIDPNRAAARVEPGSDFTSSETIYLAAADQEGNMVSFINSVFGYFGSGVVVPGTGLVLQNRAGGFTLEEGHPNTVAPGKRPFHTLVPAFVTRTSPQGDEPWLAFGVMGGGMQPQGHAQVLLNLLVFGMDLQEAIDAPRFRHQSGIRVTMETPISDEVRNALRAMGHDVSEAVSDYGGAQAVMKLTKGWAAGSDPRKDGHAAGR